MPSHDDLLDSFAANPTGLQSDVSRMHRESGTEVHPRTSRMGRTGYPQV